MREDDAGEGRPADGAGDGIKHYKTTGGTEEAAVNESMRDGRGLAAISTFIDSNLRVFRAGAATLMVGSGVTVAFLLYRRGLHGYTCASQVPASMFERRARVRVRVAKITALEPPIDSGLASTDRKERRLWSSSSSLVSSKRRGKSRSKRDLDDDVIGRRRRADVLLHAEHITILRRILRLRPRSLFPGATGDSAATFTLRLCGVSAEEEGMALAREDLVRPLVGRYCDAELLFREQRRLAPPSISSGPAAAAASAGGRLGIAGFGFGERQQAPIPVAVCHVHRRRGVLWRDLVQPRLDPKAGFGEHLLSQGVARLRDEAWWGEAEARAGFGGEEIDRSAGGMETGDSESLPALKRLLADRDRLAEAENGARETGRGSWAELPAGEGVNAEASSGGSDVGEKPEKDWSLWVRRALSLRLFGRR